MKKISLVLVLVIVMNFVTALPEERHEGKLIVKEGETLIIKDKTFYIDGDLILEEGSSLIMDNAVLIMTQRYKSEHMIDAKGAEIKITNSKIYASGSVMQETYGDLKGTELLLRIREGSTLVVEKSKIYARISSEESSKAKISNSTVAFVYWEFTCDFEIEETILGSMVFDCKHSPKSKLLLENIKENENIDLSIADKELGGSLKIINSKVKDLWSLNLEYACKKDVTIKDSEFDLVWIKFPQTENRIKIEGLPRGDVEDYDLRKAISGTELPYNVRLINVEFDKFKPEMMNSKAEIINSYVMVHPYDQSDLIIRNTTLRSFFNYGSKRIEFDNVKIKDNMQLIHKPEFADGNFKVGEVVVGSGGYFHFVFDETVIDSEEIIVMMEEGIIEGEVRINSRLDDLHWMKGRITRIYPVIAEPNAALILLKGGEIKWEGKTDADGKGFFNITFDEDNYDEEYELKIGEVSKKVNFLSDTPLEEFKDLFQRDGKNKLKKILPILVVVLLIGYFIWRKRK